MSIEHVNIPDADRHEPKGADTATDRTFNMSNGDGTTSYEQVSFNDLADLPSFGSAAENDTTDFATAAQGTTADDALPKAGGVMTGPIQISLFTLATLPSVTTYMRFLIVVSDATAGPALCISNGTNWVDIRTNATVI